MRYQHIAMLAALAYRISDHTPLRPRMTVSVAYSCLHEQDHVCLDLYSWKDDLDEDIKLISFSTHEHADIVYTTDELLAILERVLHFGLRDEQEQS